MADLVGIMVNLIDGPVQATAADLQRSGWVSASEVEALARKAFRLGIEAEAEAGGAPMFGEDTAKNRLECLLAAFVSGTKEKGASDAQP